MPTSIEVTEIRQSNSDQSDILQLENGDFLTQSPIFEVASECSLEEACLNDSPDEVDILLSPLRSLPDSQQNFPKYDDEELNISKPNDNPNNLEEVHLNNSPNVKAILLSPLCALPQQQENLNPPEYDDDDESYPSESNDNTNKEESFEVETVFRPQNVAKVVQRYDEESDEEYIPSEDEISFSCQNSKKRKKRQDLKSSKNSHIVIKCPACNNEFSRKDSLNRHIKNYCKIK